MPDIDTYPSKYYKYLETQRRVSKWVEKSGSMSNQSISQVPPLGSKRKLTSESADALIHHESASIHRCSSKRDSTKKPRRYSEARDEKMEISPALALVSSSFFIWALLPSILTLSAFVVVLSFASLNDEVYSLSSTFQVASDIQSRRLRNTMTGTWWPIKWSRNNKIEIDSSIISLGQIYLYISTCSYFLGVPTSIKRYSTIDSFDIHRKQYSV